MKQGRGEWVFESVPESWFEPVVGLWVVLGASFGMGATTHVGGQLVRPLGQALWAAVLLTTLVTAVAYGVFGIGLTRLYRRYRGFEPRMRRGSLDADAGRWLAGLLAVAVGLMILGGLASERSFVAAAMIGFDLPAYPAGVSGLALGLAGVNDMLNQAPLVLFAAALAGLFVGPAVGAVFHGVLQDTLAGVAPAAVAVGGTAAAVATVASGSSAAGPNAAVVFAFALAVAYAYRETENLLLAMAAYGLFDALALLVAWGDILASLYAAGHLFG